MHPNSRGRQRYQWSLPSDDLSTFIHRHSSIFWCFGPTLSKSIFRLWADIGFGLTPAQIQYHALCWLRKPLAHTSFDIFNLLWTLTLMIIDFSWEPTTWFLIWYNIRFHDVNFHIRFYKVNFQIIWFLFVVLLLLLFE